jgi:HSP20 family protein
MMMMLTKRQPSFPVFGMANPFEGLAGFRRLFDQPFAESLEKGCGCSTTMEEGEWKPLADVVDTKESLLLKVDLPGVKQEDISISIEDNTLSVKGERKQEVQVSEEGYSRFERSYGCFQRSMLLPPTVDADRVKASYKDGVLEIQLPKKEEAKPKTVKIETV